MTQVQFRPWFHRWVLPVSLTGGFKGRSFHCLDSTSCLHTSTLADLGHQGRSFLPVEVLLLKWRADGFLAGRHSAQPPRHAFWNVIPCACIKSLTLLNVQINNMNQVFTKHNLMASAVTGKQRSRFVWMEDAESCDSSCYNPLCASPNALLGAHH